MIHKLSQRLCEWRGRFAREGVDAVKVHLESMDELKDEDGQLSKEYIVAYVEHMVEYTKVGYRFVYLDGEKLVS